MSFPLQSRPVDDKVFGRKKGKTHEELLRCRKIMTFLWSFQYIFWSSDLRTGTKFATFYMFGKTTISLFGGTGYQKEWKLSLHIAQDVISSGPQDFRMSNCSKNSSITRQWKRDVPQKVPANIKVTEKTVFIKGDIIISLNNWIKGVAENISFLLKIKYFRAIVLHRRSSLFFSYLDWY